MAAQVSTLQQFRFRAMNTRMEVVLPCREEEADAMHRRLFSWFDQQERRFSRFLPGSELSRLNRLSGQLCFVSEPMLEVLALAERYRTKTDGYFTILIGDALNHAGYRTSFELLDEENVIATACSKPDTECGLTINRAMKSIQIHEGCSIDLGGIVKGWSVQQLAASLKRERKRGIVNAGGDLLVWGGMADNEPWLVGLENPWNPDQELGSLSLHDGVVTTSSKLGRQWSTNQGKMHHLIDPRTMRPSDSDVVQCTIIGSDVVESEVWSKVLCVAGTEKGLDVLKQHGPDAEALIFTKDRNVHFYGSRESWSTTWGSVAVDVFHEAIGERG